MFNRIVAVGALALLCAVPARATGVDQLRTFLTQTTSARGEFVQRVTRNASTQQSSGQFVFQRPGRFRWSYEKPYEQLIIADGERLTLFDKDLNQATIRKLQVALPSSPASILFGSNDFEREFEVTELGARDGLEWIRARPRAKDTAFDRIEIGFKAGLPASMLLIDNFGQTTTLSFSRLERNPKLEPDAFRFTPPKGADVLTE